MENVRLLQTTLGPEWEENWHIHEVIFSPFKKQKRSIPRNLFRAGFEIHFLSLNLFMMKAKNNQFCKNKKTKKENKSSALFFEETLLFQGYRRCCHSPLF